ncbi:glycogen synthase GlgA [Marinimicrobium sp. ABcell2]|uniref:glycogen synthase GlgA n=1 Tax=Marinimicrobium sp. ABcell2 TaxID=3069751 RepID=UPI0027B486D1|nr:glycogen synthase GlgA [Marinimicrobium sp. ABcell2]MDQ2075310.1 glycogen synthase GlgA [Marinimicrobium sp. ABcell2]
MHNILFASSEAYPLMKTGGLADVSASLPAALKELGCTVRVLIPGYPAALDTIKKSRRRKIAQLTIRDEPVTLWQTPIKGADVTFWVMECAPFSDRPGNPYQDPDGNDWPDNAERFHLFCELTRLLALGQGGVNWTPDVVHCNDWQTGLVPALLHDHPERPATVFTIHNLAYQGLFPAEIRHTLELPETFWHMDSLEFYGKVSFIKGGIAYADQLTTVSPGYAEEIRTPEYGCGLDGLLRAREAYLSGILNGVNYADWNPQTDPHLVANYHAGDLDNKSVCKQDLLQRLNLHAGSTDQPLLGFVGRLVEQKGIDLILDSLPWLLKQGCRVVVLGSGDSDLEQRLQTLQKKFSGQLSVNLGYDEALAHQITAASDLFLMPSRFEPCGLNQMYSLYYGTLPLVHKVGGLRDTVFDPSEFTMDQANGFSFKEPTLESFQQALRRALTSYQNPEHWQSLQANGMAGDYSWKNSARAYKDLYQAALNQISER